MHLMFYSAADGKACLHSQETDSNRRCYKVGTSCSVFARRQVLSAPCDLEKEIRGSPHTATCQASLDTS
ncbi:hypothetical protein BASA61_010438 [Batrachochytrium salamandrivorans]|nr:hypothetical protein BASA61_010438 [Batrachochytrium salamandrivorans]